MVSLRSIVALALAALVALQGSTGALASPAVVFESSATRFAPFSSAGTTRVVLLTDGVSIAPGPHSDALANTSPICSATVPAFDHAPFGSDRAKVVADLAAKVASLFAAYDVEVVTERPASGPYNIVAVGGAAALCQLGSGFSGYAPLDCGNSASHQDVVFVFSEGITHLGMLAVIIAHELGHAHGLPHTDEACDVMSNLLCNPDDKRFFDKPMGITPDHQGRCGLTTQANSHALLMAAVGPAGGPDAGVDSGVGDGGAADGGPDAALAPDLSPVDGAGDSGAGDDGQGGGGCDLGSGSALALGDQRGQLLWPAVALALLALVARRRGEP